MIFNIGVDISPFSPKSKSFLVPCLLFLFSFLLRLSLISKGPYHLDCLELAIKAEQTLATHQLQFLFGPGYPLTVILGAAFVFLARLFSINDPVIAVNFLSVIFGALAVVANYSLVQKLFTQRAALYSSIMLSVFPMFLAESVYGKNHAVSAFFLLAGLANLIEGQRAPNRTRLWLSALCFAMMGATRMQDLILMALPVSFLYFFPPLPQKETKPSFSNFLLFGTLIVGIALLFHLPYFIGDNQKPYFEQLAKFWQIGAGTNFRGLFSPSFRISLFMIMFELSPAGALAAVLGLGLLFQQHKKIFCFLLIWFLTPLAFYGNLATTTSRFLIVSALPLIIAQGFFFAHLAGSGKPLIKTSALLAFAFISSLLLSQIYPVLKFRHDHALLPEFAKFVAARTEPGAHIIAGDDGLFFEYYGQRPQIRRPRKHTRYENHELEKLKTRIDDKLTQGVPVYITRGGLSGYNPHRQFSKFIRKHYELIYIGEHLSEGWHKGAEVLQKRKEMLFKLEPKTSDF